MTRFDWANPHAHLYVDAKDAEAKSWTFELGALNALTNAGWKKDTVKNGDTVTVDAWLSRTKNDVANVKSVRLASGKELSGASSIVEPIASEAKPKK